MTSGLFSCFLQNSNMCGKRSLSANLGISSCSVNKLKAIFNGSNCESFWRKLIRAYITNCSCFYWMLYRFSSSGLPKSQRLIFLVIEVSRLLNNHTTHLANLSLPWSCRRSLLRGRYLYRKSSPALIARMLLSSMHIIKAFITKL